MAAWAYTANMKVGRFLVVGGLTVLMGWESMHQRPYEPPEVHHELSTGAPSEYLSIQVDSGATSANVETGAVSLLASMRPAWLRFV